MVFRHGDDPLQRMPEEILAGALRLCTERRHPLAVIEETEFPALDVYETPEELVIEAELPGADPAHFEVSASAEMIMIEGNKPEALEAGRVNYLCMERSFGTFRRVVLLTQPVNLNNVRAVYRAGVLQVRIPKVEEKRGQRRFITVTMEETPQRKDEP